MLTLAVELMVLTPRACVIWKARSISASLMPFRKSGEYAEMRDAGAVKLLTYFVKVTGRHGESPIVQSLFFQAFGST